MRQKWDTNGLTKGWSLFVWNTTKPSHFGVNLNSWASQEECKMVALFPKMPPGSSTCVCMYVYMYIYIYLFIQIDQNFHNMFNWSPYIGLSAKSHLAWCHWSLGKCLQIPHFHEYCSRIHHNVIYFGQL
jgi:hypothetical protein